MATVYRGCRLAARVICLDSSRSFILSSTSGSVSYRLGIGRGVLSVLGLRPRRKGGFELLRIGGGQAVFDGRVA